MMTAARGQILAALRERMVAYATSHLGRDAAEDLAQEALLVLEQKYGHVEKLDELLPLTFQILRFKMNDFRRRKSRRGEWNSIAVEDLNLADPSDDPHAAAERRELEERLRAALEGLEGRCRELFRLKLEGKSFAEMQTLFGVASINTIYTWDFRCRQGLMEKLGIKRKEGNSR